MRDGNRQPKTLSNRWARRWMLAPLTLAVPSGYATVFQSTTNSPPFQAALRIMPSWAWSIWWAIIIVSALATLQWGWVITYNVTNVAMLGICMAWGGSTFIAIHLQGVRATETAVALWAFCAVTSAIITVAPYRSSRQTTDE